MNALNILTTRDNEKARRRLRLFFLLWFVVNYLQGVFSGLNEDEPYYYMYAMFPDWGYFDHPPMVGVFILTGISMFGKVLGMRFMSAVSSTLFLMAVWRMIENKDKYRYVNVFILLCLSVPMLSVYGFIIVPDAPLLFFTALFLLAYKMFLNSRSVLTAMLVGLLAALMMYSKYHGILVLFFVILADLKLFKDKYFYIAIVTVLVVFSPHVWWQVENDFPSLKYHLVERSAKAYRLGYTLEYPLNQMAVFGPFLFPLMIAAVYKCKAKGVFARTLKFLFWGFLAFFLLMTFKGHVEPHWTVAAIIPAVCFTFNYAVKSENVARYFLIGGLASAILLVTARVLLFIPSLPTPYHNQRQWADGIRTAAAGAPVVFRSSYQNTSMYIYYTGEPAWSFNAPGTRRNQYDYFPIKDSVTGRRVLYLDGKSDQVIIKAGDDIFRGRWIDDFRPDSCLSVENTAKDAGGI